MFQWYSICFRFYRVTYIVSWFHVRLWKTGTAFPSGLNLNSSALAYSDFCMTDKVFLGLYTWFTDDQYLQDKYDDD